MKRIAILLGGILLAAVAGLAIYVRTLWPSIPFLHGDSVNYLLPPFLRMVTGEWHKGERPMQYLLFLYSTISASGGAQGISVMQHILGVCTGVLLFTCYVLAGRGSAIPAVISVLMGAILSSIYLLNPNTLYYEQLIAPEAWCMLLMSGFILVAIIAWSDRRWWILAAFIFLNLYLLNPMPKFILSAIAIEVLVAGYILLSSMPAAVKVKALAVSHLLYVLIVFIPEQLVPPDNPDQDRTNIEWKQMTYTHFDILMADTTAIPLPTEMRSALLGYFHRSQEHPYRILGFNSDELMWGDASERIEQYYHSDKVQVYGFYKAMTMHIIFRKPLALGRHILRQVYSFYIPNTTFSKRLYNNNDLPSVYAGSVMLAQRFDRNFEPHTAACEIGLLYPATFEQSGFAGFAGMPLIYDHDFFLYRHFDILFLLCFILFLIARVARRELLRFHILYLIHFMILGYVVAVSIVHTLDIDRFVFTVFPLLLLSVFLSVHYVLDSFISCSRGIFAKR